MTDGMTHAHEVPHGSMSAIAGGLVCKFRCTLVNLFANNCGPMRSGHLFIFVNASLATQSCAFTVALTCRLCPGMLDV